MSFEFMTLQNCVTFKFGEVFYYDEDIDAGNHPDNSGGFTIDKSCIPLDKRKEIQRVLEGAFFSQELTLIVYPDHVKFVADIFNVDAISKNDYTIEVVLENIYNVSMFFINDFCVKKKFAAYICDRNDIRKLGSALL